MPEFSFQSRSEQVAAHLREELVRGRWGGSMPGVLRLAQVLSVDHKTVMAALQLLENEGMLVSQGAGKRRKIVLPHDEAAKRRKIVLPHDEAAPTRIAILHYDAPSASMPHHTQLRNALEQAGHTLVAVEKNLEDLKMNVKSVARLVHSVDADAWVICAGSQEVLAWFAAQRGAAQPLPSFALFGRMQGIPIAGVKPNKSEAFAAAAEQLLEFGHRRIVLLVRTERRLPEPGRSERAFLDALDAHGIQVGNYNLPNWVDTPEGFQAILASLFQTTPPTALLIDEPFLFAAVQQFLAHRGIRVPDDVSLICTDNDPTFLWCRPTIAHIDWDTRPVVRRIVRWAANVSRGNEDMKQTFTPATFVEGGTVGRVKGK